ncbi:hypothetical protein [Halomonas rhizosphaerae]|uniref:Uncharacterized protein n=1 Tax=Halomonas rhizosphaerae TaxID=3043296 RepID=A0ABT6UX89_9GAMM|nr:hypothetical protein [Halomonas rhizosphaerae]MDI5890596.1 hypothetical protein [Halomonas rhizosphaerae]
MGWTTNKLEHDRRLAICETCPTVRLRVIGVCRRCLRPFDANTRDDDDYVAKVVCRCGGEIRVLKEYARCGTSRRDEPGCGCPLATRVYAWCPEGKW